MLGFAEYQTEANMLNIWKQTQEVFGGFILPVTCCINSPTQRTVHESDDTTENGEIIASFFSVVLLKY